jgi:DNA-binding MarR family transcriptional regulator
MPRAKDLDPKSRAWGLFLAAHTVLSERIEAALAKADLPPLAWYDALWELEKAEGAKLRMHELAQRVVLSRSNLTRLADRLESAELVAREDCPDDRRGYFLALTDTGRKTRERMWPIYRREIEGLFSKHLSAASAETMVSAFSAMLRAARDP